jgi:hypothetical protein
MPLKAQIPDQYKGALYKLDMQKAPYRTHSFAPSSTDPESSKPLPDHYQQGS